MDALTEVLRELERATAKFPTWPTDPLHALAVLGEEFGELTKEAVQLVYEPHKTSPEAFRKEAVQTAAMALRFVASLDRYEPEPGVQHHQEPHGSDLVAHMFRLLQLSTVCDENEKRAETAEAALATARNRALEEAAECVKDCRQWEPECPHAARILSLRIPEAST